LFQYTLDVCWSHNSSRKPKHMYMYIHIRQSQWDNNSRMRLLVQPFTTVSHSRNLLCHHLLNNRMWRVIKLCQKAETKGFIQGPLDRPTSFQISHTQSPTQGTQTVTEKPTSH
jgi:hypothetical protein